LTEEIRLQERQADHAGACKQLCQPVIGMCLVGLGSLDIAELQGRFQLLNVWTETLSQLIGFSGDIIAIETVEPDIAVTVLLEHSPPSVPSRRQSIGCKRFRYDDLWPVLAPVAVKQNVLFCALDVHLQKVDRAGCMLVAQLGERGHWDNERSGSFSKASTRCDRMAFDHGREAMELLDQIKRALTCHASDQGSHELNGWRAAPGWIGPMPCIGHVLR